MEKALSYAQEHFEDSVTGLEDFLRIPSISTNADSAGEVKRAAKWLADELRQVPRPQARVLRSLPRQGLGLQDR